MKYLLSLFTIMFSINAYCWSITDKLLYDNYESCVDHKLANVDTRRTNLYIAKQAIKQDCKKAFCTEKRSVTNEEYETCVQKSVELCETLNAHRKKDYESHREKQRLISQRESQCLAELAARDPRGSAYLNQFICSDPSIPEKTAIDYSKAPSYENCEESQHYEYCKKDKFIDDTCR